MEKNKTASMTPCIKMAENCNSFCRNNKRLKNNNIIKCLRIYIIIEIFICIISKVIVSTMDLKTNFANNMFVLIFVLHMNLICSALFLYIRYCCFCYRVCCHRSNNSSNSIGAKTILPTSNICNRKIFTNRKTEQPLRIYIVAVIAIFGIIRFSSDLQSISIRQSFYLKRQKVKITSTIPSTCTFLKKSCFEIKRCTASNLLLNYSTLATTNNVYIYDISKLCNNKEIDKIEMPDNQHWYWHVDLMLEKKALENSKMINNLKVVTDPKKACLFIVPPHTYKCFPDYSKLPYWGNNGENHVLIEMTRDQYWNKYGSPGDHEVWKNLDRFFRHRSSYFKDYGNWIGSLFTRRLFYSREYNIE